jgi:large subunit ribosomal protein L21
MYAVINAGGKQERVEVGELVDVELLDVLPGDIIQLTPLLVVDGQEVTVSGEELAAKSVTASVVGVVKGPKIVGFTYKSKTRQRRRYGHRQRYTTLEIKAIGARSAGEDEVPVPVAAVATVADGEVGQLEQD